MGPTIGSKMVDVFEEGVSSSKKVSSLKKGGVLRSSGSDELRIPFHRFSESKERRTLNLPLSRPEEQIIPPSSSDSVTHTYQVFSGLLRSRSSDRSSSSRSALYSVCCTVLFCFGKLFFIFVIFCTTAHLTCSMLILSMSFCEGRIVRFRRPPF